MDRLPLRHYPTAEADVRSTSLPLSGDHGEAPSTHMPKLQAQEEPSIDDDERDRERSSQGDQLRNALTRLQKCQDGIAFEMDFTQKMRKGYFLTFSSMLNAEDTLLSLATDDDVDGIFLYCVVHADAEQSMARYFEHGAFAGFYKNVMSEKIRSRYSWNVLPYNVYTAQDVMVEKQRADTLYAKRRIDKPKKEYKNFARKIYQRSSTGIASCLSNILQEIKGQKVNCDLVVCMVLQKRQSWDEKFDSHGHSKLKYFVSNDSITDWESSLKQYRSNPVEAVTNPYCNLFDSMEDERILSLEEQLNILSSIPNHHKWMWPGKKVHSLRFEQRFSNSSRWFPGSPRSRIIQAIYNDDETNVVIPCLQNILGEKVCFDYKPKRKSQKPKPKKCRAGGNLCEALGISREEARAIHEGVLEEMGTDIHLSSTVNVNVNRMDASRDSDPDNQVDNVNESTASVDVVNNNNDRELENQVGVSTENFNDSVVAESGNGLENEVNLTSQLRQSLYAYFCGELFRRGTIAWRVSTELESVVLMNAYHCESGDFLPYVFVHVSVNLIDEQYVYSCTCLTFSTNLSPYDGLISTCCHCRLLKEIMSNKISSLFINMSKVEDAKRLHQVEVLQLASKSGVDKFSVTVNGVDAELVTLFYSTGTGKTVVKCHSSKCQREQGSCRDVKRLSNNATLCPHLSVFQSFYSQQVRLSCEGLDDDNEDEDDMTDGLDEEDCTLMAAEWEKVFDVSTGLWNFASSSPSQATVDADRSSEVYINNVQQRWSTGLSDLIYFPDIDSEQCNCGAGWTSSENADGIVILSHSSNLFTDRGVRKCLIKRRICLARNCSKQWDGANDSVFQLSNSTCAGYELGWEFVDCVINSKMTFSGFVSCCQEKCKIQDSYFMNVNTFINWFFGSASRMRIDFRQPCPGCDGHSPIVACDGTKIGLIFKNVSVSPIEKPTKSAPTTVKGSRLDRCFLHPDQFSTATHTHARLHSDITG